MWERKGGSHVASLVFFREGVSSRASPPHPGLEVNVRGPVLLSIMEPEAKSTLSPPSWLTNRGNKLPRH